MKKVSFVLLMLCSLLMLTNDIYAGDREKRKKKGTIVTATGEVKKKSPLDNTVKYEGLFNIYQDTLTGKAYMLIKEDQLNKEYIYFSYMENGVLEAGAHRGQYRGSIIFTIKKNYGRIEFIETNTSFYFDSTNAISKAADANTTHSILLSELINEEYKEKGEYLLNADKLFLTEQIQQVKPTYSNEPQFAKMFKLGKLSTEKTKYTSIRSYPENMDIVVEYVYDNESPLVQGGAALANSRYVSVKLQHSIIAVPQNDFKPRYDDPRVGYFSTQVNDMTAVDATPYKDMIHRWNLVKKDSSLALSEPVEPIIWWIENTTPKEFRETIKQGVLAWNVAFEKAGFKNAVVVYEQPDTARWDAGDIRYNVIRWTSSPNPPFGGYGPSFVNPRTGQILGADIMMEYVLLTNRLREDKVFSISGMDLVEEENALLAHGDEPYCSFGLHMVHNNIYGAAALKMYNASDMDQSDYVKAALKDVIMHEVGHTLGLMHNMKASHLYSPADINNQDLTAKTGQIGSVMDYNLPNIALDRSKQGDYYPTRVGPYDEWAVQYGYSSTDSKGLNQILSRSNEPQLLFGNDADDMRSPGRGIDPRVMISDLTSDPITYSIERMELTKQILPTIKERYAIQGESYHEMRNAYLVLTGANYTALGVVSRYIGGVFVDRSFIGQSATLQPFTPVSYTEQKRAMGALQKYLFSPTAFAKDSAIYNYLQMQRRGFGFFSNNEDPKITDRALTGYNNVFDHLLNANVMKRITDSGLYGNKYSLSEMMNDLTTGIFKEDLNTQVNVFRQLLQGEYVDRLVKIADTKNKDYDHFSQSNSLYQLKQIKKMLATASTTDLATKAHRESLLFSIEKSLDTGSN